MAKLPLPLEKKAASVTGTFILARFSLFVFFVLLCFPVGCSSCYLPDYGNL